MQSEDFEKIWTLYRTLFPASAAKIRSENMKMVWRVALSPYGMDDVVEASMAWARKNKFFPDIADITGALAPEGQTASGETAGQAQLSPDVLPYVRKFYGNLADERCRQLHAAGLETWFEAEARGVTWKDWTQQCRKIYGGDLLPRYPDGAEGPAHA